MSRQGQRFRAIKDDVSNPTLFKVIQSQTFKEDEFVLSSLDEFINNHPSNALPGNQETRSSNYVGINPTVLSQLNRLQRSLRGLPPLFEDDTVSTNTNTYTVAPSDFPSTEPAAKINTKIVFED
ncbi:hypothetical protein CANINC_001813 [Pichia inconspicua]|uniref:Uncharacterized protein n=1 Tax=Pichia inconspicua TaxID=52247 RepID=A0A4T0X2N2_9ASCO|nr:hypothetical protein CANINC_001813 [[Candida] inconspicua]